MRWAKLYRRYWLPGFHALPEQRITLPAMSLNSTVPSTRWSSRIPPAVLACGLLLALVQFLHGRSLWVDEAMLALNIVTRDPLGLLRPLDDNQVAPILFLLLEKAFTSLVPNSEYGLRILPLLCYAAGAFAFFRIVLHLFQHAAIQVLALSLFAFNTNLIFYASEVKQYMGDLAVCCIIFWWTLKYTTDRRGLHRLGVISLVAIWFSSVTPIIVLSAFGYVVHHRWREGGNDRAWIRPMLLWCVGWCIMFMLYYASVVHDHPTRALMQRFWLDANGLLPNDPFTVRFYNALWDRAHHVFTLLLPYGVKNIYPLPLFWLIGCFGLAFSGPRRLLLLFLLPVVVHLLLAILHFYPFETRMLLYLIPCFIVVAAYGVQLILQRWPKLDALARRPLALILIPIVLAYPFLRKGFPRGKQEIKPCLAYIAEHAEPADVVYVDIGAKPAFTYYALIGKFDLPGTVRFAPARDDPEKYLADALSQHGPTWFVFTHMRKRDSNSIIAALEKKGLTPTDQCVARSGYAYRYQLP